MGGALCRGSAGRGLSRYSAGLQCWRPRLAGLPCAARDELVPGNSLRGCRHCAQTSPASQLGCALSRAKLITALLGTNKAPRRTPPHPSGDAEQASRGQDILVLGALLRCDSSPWHVPWLRLAPCRASQHEVPWLTEAHSASPSPRWWRAIAVVTGSCSIEHLALGTWHLCLDVRHARRNLIDWPRP